MAIKNLKSTRLLIISVVLIALVCVAVLTKEPQQPVGKCGPYRNDVNLNLGGAKFYTEAAKTPKELTDGLSGRPCIESNQAMLFTFSKSGQQRIWMKGMKFPIDILWISPERMVVGVERDVKPDTYPDIFANKDKPALYVLELQSGRTQELKINLGSKVSW